MVGGDKNIWVIANWKSNKTIQEALEWISFVGPKLEKRENLKVVVCPPFTDVGEVKKAVQVGNYPMLVGVQDLSPFDSGAYTGEEAATILKDFVDLAILGHSERRQNFGETDQMVVKKVNQALTHGIVPLVCVQGVDTLVPEGCKLVAFEPISAIGSGNPDTPQDAQDVAQKLKSKFGSDLEVLYGGSVTLENVKGFIGQPDISGVLIGGASLPAEEFVKIVDQLV